jgi:peptidoglycan/LPS O-acetylase OafA/YrhL
MNNNKPGTKPHYQILDGLRGVAAIIVIFFHLTEPLASSHLDNVVNH